MQDPTRDLVFYLLERGLLTQETLVDGGLTVAGDRTRHHTFAVLQRRAPGYFVKQSAGHPDAEVTLRCEAECYRLVHEETSCADLAAYLPELVLYDPERQTLVAGLIPEAENAASYHRRIGSYPEAVARLTGTALNRCHAIDPQRLSSLAAETRPGRPPWILSFDRDGENNPYGLSAANRELLQRVRSEPAVVRALESLRGAWRGDRLIHGDMKWENTVVYPRTAADPDLRLKLVDWETAGLGDPLWDVGGVLHSYLSSLILAPPGGTTAPLDLQAARRDLSKLRPALHAFWQAYQDGEDEPTDPDTSSSFPAALRLCAARLLLTAFELQVFAAQELLPASLLFALATDLFRNTEARSHELLAA